MGAGGHCATAAGGRRRGGWGARSPRGPHTLQLHPQARDAQACRHTPPRSYTHTESHTESSPNAGHPATRSGLSPPGRERAQAPAPLRPAMPALASPSCLPTAADETHACPQRTSTQAHAHRGRGQGHGRGFLPPGLGGLQGASYFQEPSLPGEGGLAWRACHRARNTSLALGSPSSGPRPDMAATSRAGSARAGLSPVISSSSHSPARQGLLFPAFYRKGTRGAEVR